MCVNEQNPSQPLFAMKKKSNRFGFSVLGTFAFYSLSTDQKDQKDQSSDAVVHPSPSFKRYHSAFSKSVLIAHSLHPFVFTGPFIFSTLQPETNNVSPGDSLRLTLLSA